MIEPPIGSSLSVRPEGQDLVVTIPYRPAVWMRYSSGLFLLFWLGGWAFGEIAVSRRLLTGTLHPFELFWLAGWTVGGAWAAYLAYRILRPTKPEIITLTPGALLYDSGRPPMHMGFGRSANREFWGSLLKKRVKAGFDRRALSSLQLRPTESSNRLTIDDGASRIDLAPGASEIEREWLYDLITKKYRLVPARGGLPVDR